MLKMATRGMLWYAMRVLHVIAAQRIRTE